MYGSAFKCQLLLVVDIFAKQNIKVLKNCNKNVDDTEYG